MCLACVTLQEEMMEIKDLQRFFNKATCLAKPVMEAKEEHESLANTFCFFSTVSDHYYRETFHSDILFTLLNPNTVEIGGILKRTFLKKFLGMFDVPFNPHEQYVVSKEDSAPTNESNGRIDLLVIGNGYSIIIENKINYAPEQENQLARYVESERKKHPNNKISIVYLTLTPDRNQLPTIDSYSQDYQDIVKQIKNGTIPLFLWAASNSIMQNDWLSKSLIDLLNDCINEIQDEASTLSATRSALVFLEQYRNLLIKLGGEKMELNEKVEALEFLVEHETETKLLFEEIWSEKLRIFSSYFANRYLSERTDLTLERIHGDKIFVLKTFPSYKVYLRLAVNVELGIVFDDRSMIEIRKEKAERKLNKILDKYPNIHNSGVSQYLTGGGLWYCFWIDYQIQPIHEAYLETKEFVDRFPDEFTENL